MSAWDKIDNALRKKFYSIASYGKNNDYAYSRIVETISKAVDIDSLEEVVHCKDCKYAHMTVNGECKYCDIWFPDEEVYASGNHFCAGGVKK